MDVQWYPGHMTKARRMMEENIRLVDLVIELVDARIPLSSRNPDIDALCKGKGRIVLLCKADLADPVKTEAFLDYFRQKGILALAADAREKKAADLVRRYVQEACQEKISRDRARGIVGRPLRAMVAGIPNVGKSTFINSFAGRAGAKTGNKPGVTRGKQWIRIGGNVELLDTPGILWPKFDNPLIGIRLALSGAIRDEVLDKQELAVWLLGFLSKEYPGTIEKKYISGTAEESTGEAGNADSLLLRIARARKLLMKGGEPDTARTCSMLIDDCKNGRIARISLDDPAEAEAMDEERSRTDASSQSGHRQLTGKKRNGAGMAGPSGRKTGKNPAQAGRRAFGESAGSMTASKKRPEKKAGQRGKPGRRK